jgi:methyl-accepting chemotaxis protein
MKINNLKIRTRLYVTVLAVVVIFLAVVLSVFINFSRSQAANNLNIHTYQVSEELDEMLLSLTNIETGERGFALTGNEASLEPYHAGLKDFDRHAAFAKELTSDNQTQQLRLDKMMQLKQQWVSGALEPTIALRRKVSLNQEQIENVIAIEQAAKGKAGMDTMRAVLSEAKSNELSLLEVRSKELASLQFLTLMTILVGASGGTLFALLLSTWLIRNITRPLLNAVQVAQTVASGDLTTRINVTSSDETGQLMQALKDMSDSLLKIVGEVRIGIDTIVTASGQIATGNLDLSSRTEQQASALEETASSMEELTGTVRQNADNARQANGLAVVASEVARKGGSVVSEVVETMSSINDSSKKIVDIIGVIDGIAFQTNILALNAAVEAARAGEQGRGFAVVASEVRSLAQRSAAAAKEIKTLISDSMTKVDAGSKLVESAGATMDEVVASVTRVTNIVAEISAASHEQSTGIDQVNQAITQMDDVTQQNAALVEEAAAAAQSLQDQAANLARVVSVFKLLENSQPLRKEPVTRPVQNVTPHPARLVAMKPSAGPARSTISAHVSTTGDDWEQF